jgi:small subunit ribosomal protein S16
MLLNFERVKYWLALGAQPSDTVARLLGQVGLIPHPPMRPILPKAVKNKDKRRSTSTDKGEK